MTKHPQCNSLSRASQKTINILKAATEIIENLSITRNPRHLLSAALYNLSFEHSVSIIHLTQNAQYGSALALYRPAYEALIKGAWLNYGASEDDLQKLASGKMKFPGNKTMVSVIGNTAPEEIKLTIDTLHDAVRENLRHDFTHGGLFQMSQRVTYNKGNIQTAGEMSTLSLKAIAVILGANALGLADLTVDKAKYKSAFNTLKQAIED